MKITGTQETDSDAFAQNIHDLYIPGLKLEDACPECSQPWVLDLSNSYLAEDVAVNCAETVHACCKNCFHEWEAGRVIVRLTLEVG